MSNWQVVSKEKHANSGWVSPTDYLRAKDSALAPLMAAEIGHALPFYPLAFVKTLDGRFQLNAIFSLQQGKNLFLNNVGRWVVPYVPAALRSYPFAMMATSSGSHVLAVDVESPFFKEQAGPEDNPILSEDSQVDPSLSTLVAFMQQRLDQQKKTDLAVQSLADFDLLEPWVVKLQKESGESVEQPLPGIFRINEQAIKALDSEKLALLTKSGALGIAYGQIFSQVRLKDLQARAALAKQQKQSTTFDSVDLDKMFDGDSEDIFSF